MQLEKQLGWVLSLDIYMSASPHSRKARGKESEKKSGVRRIGSHVMKGWTSHWKSLPMVIVNTIHLSIYPSKIRPRGVLFISECFTGR